MFTGKIDTYVPEAVVPFAYLHFAVLQKKSSVETAKFDQTSLIVVLPHKTKFTPSAIQTCSIWSQFPVEPNRSEPAQLVLSVYAKLG